MKKLNKIYQDMISEFGSNKDLHQVEIYLDKLFEDLNIDISFSKHFYDMVGNPMDGTGVKPEQLINTFNDLYNKHSRGLINSTDLNGIISKFNDDKKAPFHLVYDDNKSFTLKLK
jgi:hypothetical protein